MKILQISSELNSGSVGRIAEQIGETVIAEGWRSYIAYARDHQATSSNCVKIGRKIDIIWHGIITRLSDRHGFASIRATKKLIDQIKIIKPDVIHLHHLHGYFINIDILFNFLNESKIPIVWTFHDCWSFTGHCAYYEFIGCQKWKLHCSMCPQKSEYPKTFLDNSYRNFSDKKRIFNRVKKMTIVPVSNWLGEETNKSFLQHHDIKVIQNGIDISKFRITYDKNLIKKFNLEGKFVILGVASPWNNRKGLKFFIELSGKLSPNHQIILVGLSKMQINHLPKNIIGLQRTENIEELVTLYSSADVFVNPTLEEALGLTNIEAQACGTPVITFNSGGAPETINESTGIVVDKGNVQGLLEAIYEIERKGKHHYQKACRENVELNFDKSKNFIKYVKIYKELLNIT